MASFSLLGAKRAKPLVLHIDDSDLVLLVTEAMLSVLGYDSIRATSGEEGLKVAADRTPDLIIIDALMPVLNGYETVRRLRKQEQTAAIPIVMATGDDTVKSVELALTCGANDFIIKPITEARLKAKLAVLIKR